MKEEAIFDQARKMYPGHKRGLAVEWGAFRKNYGMKIREIVPLLIPAIKEQIAYREACDKKDMWYAEWKHFQSWLHPNNQYWTMEMPTLVRKKKCHFCQQIKSPLKKVNVLGKTCLCSICIDCLRFGKNR